MGKYGTEWEDEEGWCFVEALSIPQDETDEKGRSSISSKSHEILLGMQDVQDNQLNQFDQLNTKPRFDPNFLKPETFYLTQRPHMYADIRRMYTDSSCSLRSRNWPRIDIHGNPAPSSILCLSILSSAGDA